MFDFQLYHDDSNLMIDWVCAMEGLSDPQLDEAGKPMSISLYF